MVVFLEIAKIIVLDFCLEISVATTFQPPVLPSLYDHIRLDRLLTFVFDFV